MEGSGELKLMLLLLTMKMMEFWLFVEEGRKGTGGRRRRREGRRGRNTERGRERGEGGAAKEEGHFF